MKKILTFIILLSSLSVFAQKGNYFYVKGNYGLSTFLYDVENGSRDNGYSGGAELAYKHFFSDHWGFGTGIGFSQNKADAMVNEYFSSTGQFTDIEGDVFTSNLYIRDWTEEQKSYFVEVPIVMSYQYNFPKAKKWTLYSDAGIKLKAPISAEYKTTSGNFENRGYYNQWHTNMHDVPGRYESVTNYLPEGETDYKAGLSLTADLGMMYKISNKIDLLFGVVVDYGITDIKDEIKEVLLQDDLGSYGYNSITEATVTGDVIPFDLKAEIGLRISLFNPKQEVAVDSLFEEHLDSLAIEEIDSLEIASPDTIKVESPKIATNVIVSPERKAAIAIAVSKIVDLGKIYFPFDRSYLTDNAKLRLDSVIYQLQKYPEIKIYLSGHASNEGTNEYNIRLSQRRANTVSSYLYKHCPNSILINKEAFGESKPAEDNNTIKGRKLNRRVEILVRTNTGEEHATYEEEEENESN